MILPINNALDRIYIVGNQQIKRSKFRSLFCEHGVAAPYIREDYRVTPYNEYSGYACIACGTIVRESLIP